jgi:hypothetical protein
MSAITRMVLESDSGVCVLSSDAPPDGMTAAIGSLWIDKTTPALYQFDGTQWQQYVPEE